MKYIWIAYLVAMGSVVALADEVQLTSGRTLVGIAHEESDRWMVETRHGDIRVPKSEVRSVTPGRTAVHEYQERVQGLDSGCPTADQVVEFARWAQSAGLIRYVNPLLNRAIEIDPDHREARHLLGFVQHDGKWMGAAARDVLVEVQANAQRRAQKPRPEPTRKRSVEETPYSLGLPLLPARRTDTVYPQKRGYYGGGGVVISIGGVTTGGDIVVPGMSTPLVR